MTITANANELSRKIKLKEVMHAPAIILNVDEDFSKVEKTLREHKIKHLPVVNDNGRLVGIITLSDLYRTCAPRKNPEDGSFFYTKDQLDKFILAHIMTKDPVCLKENDTLYEAMKTMVAGGYGCIPVTDDKSRIRGVITQTDIVRVVTGLLE
jgi:CBS domain-containing protein